MDVNVLANCNLSWLLKATECYILRLISILDSIFGRLVFPVCDLYSQRLSLIGICEGLLFKYSYLTFQSCHLIMLVISIIHVRNAGYYKKSHVSCLSWTDYNYSSQTCLCLQTTAIWLILYSCTFSSKRRILCRLFWLFSLVKFILELLENTY